jgi:hypothetical protein
LFIDQDAETFDLDASRDAQYLHEMSHWIRFQGSTIGLLLHHLRIARDSTGLGALISLNSTGRARIDARRRESRPVWSYAEGFTKAIGERFGLSGQFWLDIDLTRRFIFDAAEAMTDAGRVPINDVIRASLADAWQYTSRFAGYVNYPDNLVAEAMFTGDVSILQLPGYGHITTRILWECASTIDEVRTLRSISPPDPEALQGALVRLDSSPYGTPWRWAKRLCGEDLKLSTLLQIIDFAMNPPLVALDPLVGGVSWDELYPPHRFYAACVYLASNPYLLPPSWGRLTTRREILGFRQLLEEGTGLRYGQDPVGPFDSKVLAATFDPGPLSYLGALVWSSHNLLDVRFTDPARLIDRFRDEIFYLEPTQSFEDFLDDQAKYVPLVTVFRDDMQRSNLITNDEALAYLSSCVASAELEHFLTGTGALDRSFVPAKLQRPTDSPWTWDVIDSFDEPP